MNKLFVGLLIFSCSVAFGFSRKAPAPLPSPSPVTSPSVTPSVTPTPVVSPEPSPSGRPGITWAPVQYYTTPAERATIARAGAKVNQVLQSQCFKDFMGSQKLTWTGGRTNAQVIEHLSTMSGTVNIHMYYTCMRSFTCPFGTSAVAVRYPGEVWLNQAVFNSSATDCQWASTMAHEGAGHELGLYDHSFKWNVEREYSVAYKLGGSKVAYGGDVFMFCCK